MRPLALAVACFLVACRPQPPLGLFINEKSGARLYTEGDAAFLEYTALSAPLKPQFTVRLEPTSEAWTGNLGLLGAVSVTRTEDGISITGAGEKHALRAVSPADQQPLADAADLVKALLVDDAKRYRASERCGRGLGVSLFAKPDAKLRSALTEALVENAAVSVTRLETVSSSPWADNVDITGTLAFEAVALNGASTAAATLAFTGRAVASRFPAETKREPSFSLNTLDGESAPDACFLTHRPALRYQAPKPKREQAADPYGWGQ
ncbi:MAG: hypothetical protein INH37_00415 [Myxococcaceae bacterium]|nr:hypothetical protein [Myxococcaceae bacterium]